MHQVTLAVFSSVTPSAISATQSAMRESGSAVNRVIPIETSRSFGSAS